MEKDDSIVYLNGHKRCFAFLSAAQEGGQQPVLTNYLQVYSKTFPSSLIFKNFNFLQWEDFTRTWRGQPPKKFTRDYKYHKWTTHQSTNCSLRLVIQRNISSWNFSILKIGTLKKFFNNSTYFEIINCTLNHSKGDDTHFALDVPIQIAVYLHR